MTEPYAADQDTPAAANRPYLLPEVDADHEAVPSDRPSRLKLMLVAGLGVVLLGISAVMIMNSMRGPTPNDQALSPPSAVDPDGGLPGDLPFPELSPSQVEPSPTTEDTQPPTSPAPSPTETDGAPTPTAGPRPQTGGANPSPTRPNNPVPPVAAAPTGRPITSHATGKCLQADVRHGAPVQLWSCTGSVQQQWTVLSDRTVRIGGFCLDLSQDQTSNGALVQIAHCDGGDSQRFNLNTSHDLVSLAARRCVDVRENGTANGTAIQLWTCNGNRNQKWTLAQAP
ncbi:RICIN domain-containing protein [Catellatospora citrea]|uniref:Ricin B lectin domain-containing protein n=1 Tax=Catellatospora citrea TaxID=53366 RepID=A0A8J3P3R6_9ACTN|nr:RICIN domain-containing protein [Catellatospora citrea]RKE10625.1 ricin-type beta-trefoil lectin protein [Catellatospora citrea]GIG02911.1 hypothetical protein Cci01nite_80040 [Catellatospora citrea]